MFSQLCQKRAAQYPYRTVRGHYMVIIWMCAVFVCFKFLCVVFFSSDFLPFSFGSLFCAFEFHGVGLVWFGLVMTTFIYFEALVQCYKQKYL